jgi:hypothetical protein
MRKLIFALFAWAFVLIASAQPPLVNVGSAPNDGTGDPLRNAFIKINNYLSYLGQQAITNDPSFVSASTTGNLSIGSTTNMTTGSVTYYFTNSSLSSAVCADGSITISYTTNSDKSVVLHMAAAPQGYELRGDYTPAPWVKSTTNQYPLDFAHIAASGKTNLYETLVLTNHSLLVPSNVVAGEQLSILIQANATVGSYVTIYLPTNYFMDPLFSPNSAWTFPSTGATNWSLNLTNSHLVRLSMQNNSVGFEAMDLIKGQ